MNKRWCFLLAVVLMGCTSTGRPAEPATPGLQAPAPAPVAAAPAPAALYPAYELEKGEKKWGYIDATGRFVIAPAYEAADPYTAQGLASVLRQGKWGLIDRTGKTVLEPAYESISAPTAAGEWVFSNGETHTIVSATGAVLMTSAEITPFFGDGLVAFKRGELYGYMDTHGAVVIEPQFAGPAMFREGRAALRAGKDQYILIDKTGKRLAEVKANYVGEPSDGMLSFVDSAFKHGYLSADGQVAIPPQFSTAAPFVDGFAVVNTAKDYTTQAFGVINKRGEFVIPPKYGVIENVGAGLFAVALPAEPYATGHFVKKAFFNREGKQLTDFLYYDVLKVDQGLISVTDETSTYFLDTTGAKAKGLPTVTGLGTLRPRGDLILADIDQSSSYLDRSGKVVWQVSRAVALKPSGRVEAVKHRADRLTLIWYPQVAGLAASKAEAAINADLKKEFLGQRPGPEPAKGEERLQESTSVDFTATQMGHVLIIEEKGYFYSMGAAHGMPMREYYHYDLATGARYRLADLFKPGSVYARRLTEFVRKEIASKPEGYFLNKYPDVLPDHRFTVGPEGLVIYYYPYDIAPYAAGFPTFTVPFAEIQDLINKEGAFWKALQG
ncbi:MAG TPA: WG repeat-containing protein [Symbiobacteriaceae bacterium]|nr:WG repeat-containing protein [Symbiobacteriaceae bacterium]